MTPSRLVPVFALVLVVGFAAMPKVTAFYSRIDAQEQVIEELRLTLLEMNLEIGAVAEEMANQALRLQGNLEEVGSLQSNFQAHTATLDDQTPKAHRQALREDILAPVFQIAGGDAVGSGVLIHRGEDDAGPYYLALSCYHVVRDILSSSGAMNEVLRNPLDCYFESEDGQSVTVQARMVAEDLSTDLALLRINTDLELGQVARLGSKERAMQVQSFDPIYTVGCPLGTASQATRGEVTRTGWEVDGESYWMVSSPAYFGNSGGGVFLEDTHELVGIFAKIYTHGSYRPQVITHMGLAVPLMTIHDWLESIGYGRILPENASAQLVVSEACRKLAQ
jgi:S1-C subfamily serine protease